tara:strand:+ start:9 stop:188 length:180 start_codon:yes stop_codon:yes gene_type:complete
MNIKRVFEASKPVKVIMNDKEYYNVQIEDENGNINVDISSTDRLDLEQLKDLILETLNK